eukprot:scaffold433_cov153-Isochrysis_galbana.AAC.4
MGPDPRLRHVPMHSSRFPRSASVFVCVFLLSTKITIPPPAPSLPIPTLRRAQGLAVRLVVWCVGPYDPTLKLGSIRRNGATAVYLSYLSGVGRVLGEEGYVGPYVGPCTIRRLFGPYDPTPYGPSRVALCALHSCEHGTRGRARLRRPSLLSLPLQGPLHGMPKGRAGH